MPYLKKPAADIPAKTNDAHFSAVQMKEKKDALREAEQASTPVATHTCGICLNRGIPGWGLAKALPRPVLWLVFGGSSRSEEVGVNVGCACSMDSSLPCP